MRYAGLFLLFNGFWIVDNQQMFKGQWNYIMRETDPMRSSHYIHHLEITQSAPLYMMVFMSTILLVLQIVIPDRLLQLWGFSLQQKEISVDEDLPNFFTSIKLNQADEIIKESDNMRDNYGFEIEDPQTLEILDHTKMPKKAIQGTPWYNILSNPEYSDSFAYFGAHIDEREKLIKDGDDIDSNNCE